MSKLGEQATFAVAGAMAGLTGLMASTGNCSGAGCASCFGCAGFGLMLAAAAIGKRIKGARNGRGAHADSISSN